MSQTRTLETFKSTGANRGVFENVDAAFSDPATGRSNAVIGVLSETVGVAQFTDGGSAVGTYQMAGSLPVGAIVLGTKVLVPGAFAGNTSAALTIGDGSDVDRYNTGTIDLFTAAAAGVQSGVPSGLQLVVTENRPTLTVTGNSDFTLIVTDAGGSVSVSIYYMQS